MIITIDGLSALGKTTVATALAQELNMVHLTTGLIYRALAYLLIKKDKLSVNELKKYSLHELEEVLDYKIWKYSYRENRAKFFLSEQDLTSQLRNPDIAIAAGSICKIKKIRALVNRYCRDYAKKYSVIADGRDCGSVLFINADYKFYLTASLEVRIQRWQKAMLSQNILLNYEQAESQLQQRDLYDPTLDSLSATNYTAIIDVSNLPVSEVVRLIKSYINN